MSLELCFGALISGFHCCFILRYHWWDDCRDLANSSGSWFQLPKPPAHISLVVESLFEPVCMFISEAMVWAANWNGSHRKNQSKPVFSLSRSIIANIILSGADKHSGVFFRLQTVKERWKLEGHRENIWRNHSGSPLCTFSETIVQTLQWKWDFKFICLFGYSFFSSFLFICVQSTNSIKCALKNCFDWYSIATYKGYFTADCLFITQTLDRCLSHGLEALVHSGSEAMSTGASKTADHLGLVLNVMVRGWDFLVANGGVMCCNSNFYCFVQ